MNEFDERKEGMEQIIDNLWNFIYQNKKLEIKFNDWLYH